jgi:hypothetical protein
VIDAFTVSPPQVEPGQPVTLAWKAVAQWVRLTPLDWQGKLTNTSIPLPLTGTLVVTPQVDYNSQGYILFAGTGDAYVSASVNVKLTCQAAWFFAKPPAVCPVAAPQPTLLASEPFEHGLMLWVAHWTGGGQAIVVLFDKSANGGGDWQDWPDEWVDGMPDSDPTLTPPPGLFQPRRGFGKLWRENKDVGSRLGWATAPEATLPQGFWQWDSGPKYSSGYVSGPGGAVYVLGPEHANWSIWTGATTTP